ncbi:hypothetical protein SB717_24855 [Priestia sp. SIMBA_032]|uniref:hypothetical protein n=1 Tax=Priestia sp. SIMBA_032 TaxID=3085775 RepID=UPI00397AF78D
MLGIGLVAYIFYEIDQRSKDVPTRAKVEHNEEQWEHDPKEKEIKTNKKREGFMRPLKNFRFLTSYQYGKIKRRLSVHS